MIKPIIMAACCLGALLFAKASNTTGRDTLIKGAYYRVYDSVLIPAKDGVTISALVVLKKEEQQPLPVILQFTIYARHTDIKKAIEAAEKGYVGVMAYSRGKRYGTGEIMPYEHDAKDVYEVIDWISKQNWCNGKIGMYGGSYNGFTQWAATKRLH
ncbi:MAG TPA: acylase, partial [Chitinophagaceae bacterium]|nr:acylase [Chitinophagaceae bacterium]